MREVPFHKPFIMQDELDEVADTLRKGWLTMGPKTIEFENAFKKRIQARNAVSVNSCTAALHLALKVIGLQENDEVIIPSMTFTATGEVVRYFNAKPVIVDVDRNTQNILVDEIEKNITTKTKAIIPIHYGGHPADMDGINELAAYHRLRVIEDAAHCFPSYYKDRPVGDLSDITAFSFYATKTLSTGEGGMAATSNDKFAERMSILRLHGISKDAWQRYSKHGNWYYEVVDVGYKYNMTDIQAALGLAQLRKVDDMWERRIRIARQYDEAFRDNPCITVPTVREYAKTSWHLYVIKLNIERLKIGRNRFISQLQSRGVGASVHFIPLHKQPVYRSNYDLDLRRFRNSEWLYERIVSLPIFPGMSQDEVEYVIENVSELVRKNEKAGKQKVHIPLAQPDITYREKKAVMDVLSTPNLSFGPKVEEFEKVGAQFAGRKYGVAVNSGTSGLHLVVKSLGLGPGDRVITSPFSFIASSNCILFEKAEPVFVDIDRNTLNFQPELIEQELKKDTHKKIKAILAVDIFGHPVDWDSIYDIADRYRLKVIEDSSEAVGSQYRSPDSSARRRWRKNKMAGSFGDASVFAFYPNKQITTGEGGLILTDSRKIYDACKSMRNQGRGNDSAWFDHMCLGYNYRISDINCALGVVQFNRIDRILHKRQLVAEHYTRQLCDVRDLETPFCEPHVTIGWFVYVVRLSKKFKRKDRNEILQRLRSKGIECNDYFAPIHLQPFYRKMFGYKRGCFPVTEHIADRTIALPFYTSMDTSKIDCVAGCLKSVLKSYR